MPEITYTFELECPRCGKCSLTTGTKRMPPPVVNCGDCLMNDVEIVEFTVVRVWVNTEIYNDGAST